MINPNQELLSWAVENIKEWDDDYTHLRSDSADYNSLFYTRGTSWKHIDAQWVCAGEEYTTDEDLYRQFATNTPQVITKQEWLDGVAAKNAPTSSPEAQQGHVHAEIMAEYALVAKTNPEPWEEFESKHKRGGDWVTMYDHPYWDVDCDYRRKPTPPKTMDIGGVVVEAWPLEEMPPAGLSYWALIVEDNAKFDVDKFTNDQDSLDEAILYAGKAFSTKEQAQAVADALNLVYNRAIGKA